MIAQKLRGKQKIYRKTQITNYVIGPAIPEKLKIFFEKRNDCIWIFTHSEAPPHVFWSRHDDKFRKSLLTPRVGQFYRFSNTSLRAGSRLSRASRFHLLLERCDPSLHARSFENIFEHYCRILGATVLEQAVP